MKELYGAIREAFLSVPDLFESSPPEVQIPVEYNVFVFPVIDHGPLPAGTPVQNAQLTPYRVLTIWQKFPSEQDRMLSFVRVTSEPKKAKFNIIGDVIPRGQADCLPQPSKCEAIALGPGQSEELERRSQTGQPEVIGLQVVSIRPRSHDRTDRAKSARLALEHESRG